MSYTILGHYFDDVLTRGDQTEDAMNSAGRLKLNSLVTRLSRVHSNSDTDGLRLVWLPAGYPVKNEYCEDLGGEGGYEQDVRKVQLGALNRRSNQ